MASPRLDKVTRRDPKFTYNPITVKELKEIAPVIDWNTYFKNSDLKEIESLIVSELRYLKALNTMWQAFNLDIMKKHMKWSMIYDTAWIIFTDLENTNFDFYRKTMQGAKRQQPQDERVLATVNDTHLPDMYHGYIPLQNISVFYEAFGITE